MTAPNRLPARFNLLTAVIWLLVAAGIIFLLWQVINRLSASYLPVSTATPNLTQVYQTISAILTAQQTNPAATSGVAATPSPSPRSTQPTSILIPSQDKTSTPGAETRTPTPTIPCDQAMAGKPIDISIPDDSLISPGQSFIKIWKLVNIGTCAWTTSYSVSFFYGDRMGAPESVALKEEVRPAQSVEISIDMVAPMAPGTYQGNWKLSNPDGITFGIGPNGGAPFWVRIIVPANPSSTTTTTPELTPTFSTTGSPFPTSTSTATTTTTATATPPVQASRELTAIPGDAIDLDTLTLNSNDEDLQYRADADFHWLAPLGEAMIGVFGSLEPNLSDCQSASMSQAPIAVESLSQGTYLCYITHEGRYGKALFVALDPDDFTLILDLLTWAHP